MLFGGTPCIRIRVYYTRYARTIASIHVHASTYLSEVIGACTHHVLQIYSIIHIASREPSFLHKLDVSQLLIILRAKYLNRQNIVITLRRLYNTIISHYCEKIIGIRLHFVRIHCHTACYALRNKKNQIKRGIFANLNTARDGCVLRITRRQSHRIRETRVYSNIYIIIYSLVLIMNYCVTSECVYAYPNVLRIIS